MSDNVIMRNYRETIVVILAIAALYIISTRSYLLFHSLVEIFSVLVASAVFVIVWNSRSFMKNNYLLVVGISYLFIAIIDLLHTLGYKGMGVFPGYDANFATQLWILARYIQSISLLIAPFFLSRSLNAQKLLMTYFILTSLLLLSIFMGIFPDCYVVGSGLTSFKIASEYLISLILLGALLMLLKNKDRFDGHVLNLLLISIALTIFAELAFTFYVGVYDFPNLVGHLLKLLSFYLVYKAVVVTALTKPYDLLYRELKLSEMSLRKEKEAQENLSETLALVNKILRHDILNDLNVIYMAIDNLSYRVDAEEIGMSRGAISRSLKLIEEIRDLENSEYSGKSGSLELRELIGDISKDFPVEINVTGKCNVIADRTLNSVITNIIRNAIFHGKADRIDITMKQTSGLCEMRIADNGRGIPDEAKAHVFEKGYKYGETGHTGIGLYIARKIVERYGEITVEDNHPTGAVFVLKLRSGQISE
ncbi:MAG: MASE3 domain-containing protein [Methanolobus sp.]|nr:MASE3 domain-containing protein [Methanolobus sp.]